MHRRRDRKPPDTPLEAFLSDHEILPSELARASGCSREGIIRMRYGRKEPTRRQMAAALAGAREILPDAGVEITDLFSFDDGPLPKATKDWRRVIKPGRPKKGEAAEKK